MCFKRKKQTVVELEAIKRGILLTASEIKMNGVPGGWLDYSDIAEIKELNIKIELAKLEIGGK